LWAEVFLYCERSLSSPLHHVLIHQTNTMPPRPANSSGHLHKKRRPVSIVSSRESSLSPSRQSSFPHSLTPNVRWGSNKAYLPYHEEEYPHAVTIPHPHFHSTPAANAVAQEDLYGVPVLADQVDFEPQHQTPATRDETPYLKRIFSKKSKSRVHGVFHRPRLIPRN
jgi:hypothetical protein